MSFIQIRINKIEEEIDMQKKVLITILVDKSSSMKKRVRQTIAGLNEYIDTLRESKTNSDTRINIVTFSSTRPLKQFGSCEMLMDVVLSGQRISEVRSLVETDMNCEGFTPLLAAIQEAVTNVSNNIGERTDIHPVFVIQTDGEENTSSNIHFAGETQNRRVSFGDIQQLIKAKENAGWEFVFMGCDVNAYLDGGMMGISQSKTVSYGDDEASTISVCRATAMATSAYISGESLNIEYTDADKMRAGDKYAGYEPKTLWTSAQMKGAD